MRRTGIDLSPSRCIIVDAETSRRFRKDGESKPLRLHRFARLTHPDPAALTAELRRLIERDGYPRRAWVNLWDVTSSHQYLLLPTQPRAELKAAARQYGAAALGLDPADVAVGVSIGEPRGEPGHQPKTEVSFFSAAVRDLRSRLQPVVDAGFHVDGVTTPCGALWSQARLRRPLTPGDVHAFVVLNIHMSALAIFANGFLLYARDLSWGYEEEASGAIDRHALAARLSAELRRSFLYLKQYWEQDVSQLVLCGDMPEIRSLTAPLIERLNIEVETLDTLEGIDTSALPDPVDRFTEHVAAYRLAAAIAVEPTPVNLRLTETANEPVHRAGLGVFVAGSAAAVALAAYLYAQAAIDRQNAESRASAPVVSATTIPVTRQDRGSDTADTHGPRMARMLETLSQATPRGVTLRGVKAVPDGGIWRVSIDAVAKGPDPERARAAAETFLEGLASPSAFGATTRPATRRVLSEGSTVELAAEYGVRK
ncbi:MAG: hypothetical protein ND807_10965 [Vicinamibacterales bacterium]|nr:hypothetical protein [Vicinamibacterales bacterium]